MQWEANFYDDKLGFVSQLGAGIVDLLEPTANERILDLGCGTGELSFQVASCGASVTGLDVSESMISTARSKYPAITFIQGDAETFRADQPFDAVMSNAALHWMLRPASVLYGIRRSLKPGGRLVAELGAHGNVSVVRQALRVGVEELGRKYREPWFFPTPGQYSALLEAMGFDVAYVRAFSRPTPMIDGAIGLEHWVRGFAPWIFQGLDARTGAHLMHRVEELCYDRLFTDGQWVVDYRRLQVVALRRD